MIMKPLRTIIACTFIFILIQVLAPKVAAIKRNNNIDEYIVENQGTRKKQNYMANRNTDILRNRDNLETAYNSEIYTDANPEELSAFIVDYANMIRNDVILLDNSVETRTRKRGNIKVEKYNKDVKDFGENAYPRFIEVRNCSAVQQQSCLPPYICKENLYHLTILKRRKSSKQESLKLPETLRHQWIAENHPVSVGCICTRDYVI